jgi:hypothetical protein
MCLMSWNRTSLIPTDLEMPPRTGAGRRTPSGAEAGRETRPFSSQGSQATLAASVAAIPKPRSHRAIAGTDVLWRAESSITIELT